MKIVSNWLVTTITGGKNAITLFPFVFFRTRSARANPRLVNHENIHLMQQLELLIIPFYLWYSIEYLTQRSKGFSHHQAYRRISFEKEAFANDQNPLYLKTRKPWSFIRFLKEC